MRHGRQKNRETATGPIALTVNVRSLPQKGMVVTFEADTEQRDALAKAHELSAVATFRAELLVSVWKKRGVRVRGRVKASIVQPCVVTLEPVSGEVDEAIDAVFLPEGSALTRPEYSAEGEILLDPEGPDAPETYCGDSIDVGALAEEFFELGIDPYPRAKHATDPVSMEDDARRSDEDSPFAKLLSLKRKS